MEPVFDFLTAYWPTILVWATISLIFAFYIVKIVREGRVDALLAMALIFVKDMAKQAREEITPEDIAYLAGLFYDRVMAGTYWAKLIPRELFVARVWELWQQYVKVECVARAAVRTGSKAAIGRGQRAASLGDLTE